MPTHLLKDEPVIWGWSADQFGEAWEGPFKTKAEAEGHGLDQEDGPGYVTEARYISTRKAVHQVADNVRENLVEALNEIDELSWSEEGVFTEAPLDQSAAAFEEAIAAWAEKYLNPLNAWMAVGTPTKVEEVPE
mgnify:CR=1 FL=1